MNDNSFSVFEELGKKSHEQVVFCSDEASGLKAIIAIHDTILGPALGGCRMYPYASEKEALTDVLRLSRGMTYKAAVSGLDLGGGKAVIIGDPKKMKTELLFRAFGRFIEGLGGRYITAEDVGTTMQDMEWIRKETTNVVGISRSFGGSGDPSPVTALGVFSGVRAAVKEQLGKDSLSGLRVAVQGVGHVGYYLVGHLVKAGCKVVVADVDAEAVKRTCTDHKVESVSTDKIYDVDCDIFAPCAMGASVNESTIPRLKCSIIAGAANNQLLRDQQDAAMLQAKGILYAPDYVINAGGLINVSNELAGYNQERALAQAETIYDILMNVFAIAKRENIPTFRAADELAMQRVQQLQRVRRTFTGTARRR